MLQIAYYLTWKRYQGQCDRTLKVLPIWMLWSNRKMVAWNHYISFCSFQL